MPVSGIFSRPTYERLAIDPAGRSHLIVADHVLALEPTFFATSPTGTPVEVLVDDRRQPGISRSAEQLACDVA